MDISIIENYVKEAVILGGSDLHFIKGLPVKCRINGDLRDIGDKILTEEDCEDIAAAVAEERYKKIKEIGELDLGINLGGERCRVNIFRQQGFVSMALRILSNNIPQINTLGLPPVAMKFSTWNKGIILVTGETGSGKSTTLAAILNEINKSKYKHIITLEDPIEYIYTPDKCVINQREIGRDTESYGDGLRAILREDPDIILIGEMRDLTTIETALTAAETGHLVFATLHTNSAADAVDRIVGIFPENRQQQIRLQLSMTLKAVLTQQLVSKKDRSGRVLACEAMIPTLAIKNLIREGKTPQIASAILSSGSSGSVTMDNSLIELVKSGQISTETAVENASDVEVIYKKLGVKSQGQFVWK